MSRVAGANRYRMPLHSDACLLLQATKQDLVRSSEGLHTL